MAFGWGLWEAPARFFFILDDELPAVSVAKVYRREWFDSSSSWRAQPAAWQTASGICLTQDRISVEFREFEVRYGEVP